MAKKEFNHYDWKNYALNESEGSSIFNVDPEMAHKIWDLVTAALQDGSSFDEKFPTASGFFNYLNQNIK